MAFFSSLGKIIESSGGPYIFSADSSVVTMGSMNQPIITTRIYVLHKITIALKFMS